MNQGIIYLNPACTLNLEENRDKLNQEICYENLTTNEEIDIIEIFEEFQGRLLCKLPACGCCGIKTHRKGNPNIFHKKSKLVELSIL